MLKLETKLFKYGYFKENSILEFNSESEILDYIEAGQEYSEYVKDKSDRCEESCRKWTETFTYKGVEYNHDVDC